MTKYNFFNKYFFTFLGSLMFLTYLWFRFIRERLPKDIPFNLSVWGFILLLEITLIYLFVCLSYAGSSNNKVVKILIDWLFIPLEELHDFFRTNYYTSKFFNTSYSFIIKNNEKIIKNFNHIDPYVFLWLIYITGSLEIFLRKKSQFTVFSL